MHFGDIYESRYILNPRWFSSGFSFRSKKNLPYARVADGSVFVTFAVAVAGKYFVILPLGFGRETHEK